MNKELQKKLFDTYPNLFRYVHEEQKDYVRPISLWGIECWDGWYALVDQAACALSRLSADLRITQVKQKLAKLRIYVEGPDESIIRKAYDILYAYEQTSGHVCEQCGAAGTIGGDSCLLTLCPECRLSKGNSSSG